MTKIALNTAQPEITVSQQDVYADLYTQIGPHKIHVHVRSNAYSFQSCAWVEVWHPTDLAWNLVYSIPHARMMTKEGLYVYASMPGRAPADHHFREDVDKLLAGAKAILGG